MTNINALCKKIAKVTDNDIAELEEIAESQREFIILLSEGG